jgi:hypothetical protein
LTTNGGVYEPACIQTETLRELVTTKVGWTSYLDDGGSNLEAGTGREVVFAQVEINIELVARELPSVSLTGYQQGCSSVHYRQLRVGMRRSVRPIVAYEALGAIQHCFQEDFSLVFGRTTNDELHSSLVSGGTTDLVETTLKEGGVHVSHPAIMPSS